MGAVMEERSNEEWLASLHATGKRKQEALADLRAIVTASLPYALSKYIRPSDPRFDPLIQEVAQETLLRVMDRLETFEGRSRLTTWVHTIAVRIALTKLRRARWKEVSLDELQSGPTSRDKMREMPDPSTDVAAAAEQHELMAMMEKTMAEVLTEKQRTALAAVAIHGMPIEEVAARMGSNRNALYKLLHDARLKLKDHFTERGMPPAKIIASFEK
jgi:RNA polymerase sigma-70 factor (ECF subfamily)